MLLSFLNPLAMMGTSKSKPAPPNNITLEWTQCARSRGKIKDALIKVNDKKILHDLVYLDSPFINSRGLELYFTSQVLHLNCIYILDWVISWHWLFVFKMPFTTTGLSEGGALYKSWNADSWSVYSTKCFHMAPPAIMCFHRVSNEYTNFQCSFYWCPKILHYTW